MTTSASSNQPVGALVREWRERRGVSQLGLALKTDISARHLSFVETGRSRPSRDVVLRLAAQLDMPLRQRNRLLLAAGYAPAFPEHSFDAPELAGIRRLIEQLLAGHEPYPALAVDRRWDVLAANAAAAPFLANVSEELRKPPVNAIRLALHPDGMAPRIANFSEWRSHILERLAHQIEATADQELLALDREIRAYPSPPGGADRSNGGDSRVIVPLRLTTPMGTLNLVSTTMVFGTPLDVTIAELAIETFLPADAATAELLRTMASR
jgi:transcriptional regulator with XRE-family HTH domain